MIAVTFLAVLSLLTRFLALLLPVLLALIELFLQIAKRFVGQVLLITQGFSQVFHGLLAGGLGATFAAFTLSDAQVFHQLV